MAGRETFDISEKERNILEWKYARRLQLREEYLKQVANPIKPHVLPDTGFARYNALKLTTYTYFKPNARGLFLYMGTVLSLVIGSMVTFSIRKANKERIYRTGQVSYADRLFKFQ